LALARLRVRCLELGIREVALLGQGARSTVVKIGPVQLRESRKVRLGRLWPKASYVESSGELRLPLSSPEAAVDEVTEALEQLLDAS